MHAVNQTPSVYIPSCSYLAIADPLWTQDWSRKFRAKKRTDYQQNDLVSFSWKANTFVTNTFVTDLILKTKCTCQLAFVNKSKKTYNLLLSSSGRLKNYSIYFSKKRKSVILFLFFSNSFKIDVKICLHDAACSTYYRFHLIHKTCF